MTTEEISNLKIDDLIYFWYPAYGDLDLFESEVVEISDTEVKLKAEVGLGFEFKAIPIKNLVNHLSRNSIEEFCIKEQACLKGKEPRDFRPLNKRL